MTSFQNHSATPLKALLLCILLTAITFLPFSLCAATKSVEKTVKIADFSKISASSGIKVIYSQGSATGTAKVTVSQDLEKYLKVEVKNNCLQLYYDRSLNRNKNVGETVVTVQSPSLNKINMSSAAALIINGSLKMQSPVKMELSSASSVTIMQLTCSELDAEVSSAASLKVTGMKGDLDIDTSSASNVTIDNATTVKADIESSSASSVKVSNISGTTLDAEVSSGAKITLSKINFTGLVEASASSGGVVNISGKGGSFKQSTSSGGSVSTHNFSTSGTTVSINSESSSSDMEGYREELKSTKQSLAEQRLALAEQRKQLDLQRLKLEEQRKQLAEQRRQLALQKQALQKEKQKNRKTASKKTKSSAKKKKDNGNSDSAYVAKSDETLRIP